MTKLQKITELHAWKLSNSVYIAHATYRQALSYRCYLVNRYGDRYFTKPLIDN